MCSIIRPKKLGSVLALLLCLGGASFAQDGIDWNRARRLHQKEVRGEPLTKEEQAYLDKAKQVRRRQNQAQKPIAPPAGLKPLCDMTDAEDYKGQGGGLYGEGRNTPPPAHLKAALERAGRIQPLDGGGKPSDNGKVALVSIGMSNTTQEFSAFVQLANADRDKSPHVVLVDGAQGGMEALAWDRPAAINRPNARNPWDVLDQRLKQAGVTPLEVQVVWIKQARAMPANQGDFPKHAEEMKGHMLAILEQLKQKFPNLQLVYLSSRIYAGFARTNLNPEPYAYETAFVVRGLIQDQIAGKALNFDPAQGEVKSALLLWGPYLWANGEQGRGTDELVWKPDDFGDDGTHPSPSGRRKVAQLLLAFFKTDPTAKTWFRK